MTIDLRRVIVGDIRQVLCTFSLALLSYTGLSEGWCSTPSYFLTPHLVFLFALWGLEITIGGIPLPMPHPFDASGVSPLDPQLIFHKFSHWSHSTILYINIGQLFGSHIAPEGIVLKGNFRKFSGVTPQDPYGPRAIPCRIIPDVLDPYQTRPLEVMVSQQEQTPGAANAYCLSGKGLCSSNCM